MKIHNKIGSKERLYEMFLNVNKVKLNENINNDSLLINSFEKLINKTLNIGKTKTQLNDNVTYITIQATDDLGGTLEFIFELTSNETTQTDVYNINNVILTKFTYVGQMGDKTELTDNDLSDFNQKYTSNIYNAIEKYIDIESEVMDDEIPETDNTDEIYENAIKTIDEVDDFNPTYKKSVDDIPLKALSNSFKNFNEEKKNKIIKAALNIVISVYKIRPSDMDRNLYIDLVKNVAMELVNTHFQTMNEDDIYPDKIGKSFKVKNDYPKQTVKRPKKVSISENDIDDKDIENLSQSREERGDQIEGGLGDDKSPQEFDPEQVKMGIGVEMSDTNDPLIALEIALDHLTEDPQYYTLKDDPEASAQAQASSEASEDIPHSSGDYTQDGITGVDVDRNGNSIPTTEPDFNKMEIQFEPEVKKDKSIIGDTNINNIEDILLGFKPKNVGDEITENSDNEDYDGNVGDKYYKNGDEYTVSNKKDINGDVILKGQDGERKIKPQNLGFTKNT